MALRLPDGSGEPAVATWESTSAPGLVARLGLPSRAGGNRVILVDGRSAGGKTTLAERLRAALPDSVVVHTDDIAWNFSFFDWDVELIEHMIGPVRRNEPVRYQPPGWAPHGREGTIDVEPGHDLIVEGVGAGRAGIAAHADAVIWVQSDVDEARTRGLARDLAEGVRDATEIEPFWDEWMAAERPFLEAEQPWSRATVIVAGRSTGDGDDRIDVGDVENRRPAPT